MLYSALRLVPTVESQYVSEVDKILAEAAEKIRKEGYMAGWADCLAVFLAAAEKATPPDMPVVGSASNGVESKSMDMKDGPRIGTTPYYSLQVVRKSPGMTGAEVVSAVHEGGHRVSDASIRISLSRLAERGLVVNRHRKWFPA
jgi:hypothetical protein